MTLSSNLGRKTILNYKNLFCGLMELAYLKSSDTEGYEDLCRRLNERISIIYRDVPGRESAERFFGLNTEHYLELVKGFFDSILSENSGAELNDISDQIRFVVGRENIFHIREEASAL